MKISDLKVDGYERVVRADDEETGLKAFIAVHDTTLGPALGGLRMWPYEDEDAALTDVLRLSKGMSYKSAIARTGLGGGKSVIIGDPREIKTPELLQAMGRFVDFLDGLYITAEDVNIRVADLTEVRKGTRYVAGLSREQGGSGNPSPYTGYGVFLGIKTCLKEAFGSDSCQGKHIVVQGVGAVAKTVIARLLKEGAHITATDINQEKIKTISALHPEIKWVDPEAIFDIGCDVFAPHALGAIINDETIPRLKCPIVAGAANNQLAEVRHGDVLREKNILYAPDFVINSGGIVNVSCEFADGGYNEEVAMKKIANVVGALESTFARAKREGIATNRAAIGEAKSIIAAGKKS
ncbi:MAG: Glu/Leu/Phe/Val dehydrogenase dimerization domain-containing protein [Planctomycetota bacterium]